MFRQIKSLASVVVVIAVVMSYSPRALASVQQAMAERYKNECTTCEGGTRHDKMCEEHACPDGACQGTTETDKVCVGGSNDGQPCGCPEGTCTQRTASCLRKIVYGSVTRPQSDKFASCTPQYVGLGYVVIDCSGGDVTYGDAARVWFLGVATSQARGPVRAKWYSDANCSNYIGPADPAPFIGVTENAGFNVIVEHGAHEWNDETNQPGAPVEQTIHGRQVRYAVTDYFRPPEELTEDLFTDQSITWVDPGCDFTLTTSEPTDSCDLGALDENDVVLLRFYTGASGTDTYELVQFCMRGTCIPAVSLWGVAVIALLLAAGGTIIIRRRRAMAT